MKIFIVVMLAALLACFVFPSAAYSQGVVELPGFGSVYYGSHVINPPNAERYSSLILHMWGYVKEICAESVGEEAEWCYPQFPKEINIHIVPYTEFMERWRGRPNAVEDTCGTRQEGCVLYGFTGFTLQGDVFDIYFHEEPIDFFLIHEITHVIESMRGELPDDEERTNSRGIKYYLSPQYVEWLKNRK